MKKQREIDDIAVTMILRALENGISLHGDRVYEEMLEQYPHYQYKYEQRQKKINRI